MHIRPAWSNVCIHVSFWAIRDHQHSPSLCGNGHFPLASSLNISGKDYARLVEVVTASPPYLAFFLLTGWEFMVLQVLNSKWDSENRMQLPLWITCSINTARALYVYVTEASYMYNVHVNKTTTGTWWFLRKSCQGMRLDTTLSHQSTSC